MALSDQPLLRRRSRKGLYVALAVSALVVLALLWKHHKGGTAALARGSGRPDGNTPTSVTVARAATGDIPLLLTGLGTVTPLVTVTVRSQLSGYLTQIAFQEGQDVKQGDFLAQVDPRPYDAILEQYEGNIIRDQALLKNAQLDMTRYQNLSRLDSIARQNVDTQAATVAQYQGAVKTDQGQIDATKLDLIYAHITAPSDGRVGLRQVDVGNYVTAGDTNGIVVLTQLKPISVIFTLPQTELGPVLLRLREAQLAVTAYGTDNVTVVGTGTVETVDNQIDTTTGTVKLRAIFPNDDESLFPNQFVNASLLVDTVHDAIVIPNEAVQHGTPGTYVYLVGPDSTVSLRTIAIGASANGMTQVTGGLQVGDEVVLDGTSRLKAGSKVSIAKPPPAAGAGTPGADDGSAAAPAAHASRHGGHHHRPAQDGGEAPVGAMPPAGPGAAPGAASQNGSGGESGGTPPPSNGTPGH